MYLGRGAAASYISCSIKGADTCIASHDDPARPLFNAVAVEELTERRGGILEDTPVVCVL
jgi:hypothetical protein